MKHELWHDKNCLLIGDVDIRDDSFNHEFGVQQATGFNVTFMHVIVYIGGFDYDITEFMKEAHPNTFDFMEQSFLNHVREKHADSVA